MSSRKEILNEIIKDWEPARTIICAPIPKVTIETITKNRKLCALNACGCYETSWTCPPHCGSEEFCIDKISKFKDADVYIREYKNVNLKDKTQLEPLMNSFREECRKIMVECRKRGFDAFALADGPCSYCKRCAVLDQKPCYHPDMQVPSVSGYGIDMGSYLESLNEKFTFSQDTVTLYGIILYR